MLLFIVLFLLLNPSAKILISTTDANSVPGERLATKTCECVHVCGCNNHICLCKIHKGMKLDRMCTSGWAMPKRRHVYICKCGRQYILLVGKIYSTCSYRAHVCCNARGSCRLYGFVDEKLIIFIAHKSRTCAPCAC